MLYKGKRVCAYVFLLGVLFFVTGCAPSQLEEKEPLEPESVETLPIEQVDSAAYPSPDLNSEKIEAYPEPVVLALPTAYPEPEPAVQLLEAQQLQANVVASYPHNNRVFTQGLLWHDGYLYESGGLQGESALYRVDLVDGQAAQQVLIGAEFFAEGIALVEDKIIMLTWQNQTALVFDRESLVEIGRFNYSGQGWGLCYDESNGQLWMSDGSDKIVSRDPETFEIIGEIAVTLNGTSLTQINELECVDGVIYANLWKSDMIVGIGQETGAVMFQVDASGLLTAEERATLQAGRQVLNGIAYNRETERFYLTGKQWPKLFEVEFR